MRKRVCKTTRQLSAFARGEETCMHEKANMSVKAHSPRKRKRVCTRKPTRQSRRIRQGEETCMHEKANTSIKISDEETCMHEKANTSARAHSLQVRKRVCTSSPEARKRVCTRKPTLPFKRIRLGEETCMHEKANTSVKTRSLGRGNVYARESHHFNSNAFTPGGGTCIHEFA